MGVRSVGYQPVESLAIELVEPTPEALQSAYRSATHGRGFTLLVAELSDWLPRHGLRMLQPGGTLIDLDASAACRGCLAASRHVDSY